MYAYFYNLKTPNKTNDKVIKCYTVKVNIALPRSSTRAHLLLLQLRVQLLVVDAGAAVSQLLLLGLLEPRVQLVVKHVIGLAPRTRRQQSLGAQR